MSPSKMTNSENFTMKQNRGIYEINAVLIAYHNSAGKL